MSVFDVDRAARVWNIKGTIVRSARLTIDSGHFQRLCAGLHHLSPRQVSELESRLSGLGERMDVLAALDGRAAGMCSCPRCGAEQLGRWGLDRRGLQRLRCRACGGTCSASAGSPLAGLRRPEAFRAVLEDMINAVRPASCRRLVLIGAQ